MKTAPRVSSALALLFLFLVPLCGFGCENLKPGQTFWIRLASPLSSYSAHRGDPVHAILSEDVVCNGEVVLPAGSQVDGEVHIVRKVGWGIRHETAGLDVHFEQITTTSGNLVTVSSHVIDVENAREHVKNGLIEGIRATDSPEGRITSRYRYLPTLNPYSDVGLIAFKVAFPIFPEPEIYLPAGTELRLVLREPAQTPVAAEIAEAPADRPELDELVSTLPRYTATVQGEQADLVNLVFLGSREQVESAFLAAGWEPADSFNRHSFFRSFYTVLNNSGYARAPMRTFLLEGQPAAMNWQRSLNSYNKRDHLRIWESSDSLSSEAVWLSSSTHDTSATLSVKYHRFVHHIDSDIDEERGKVIRELTAAGCLQSVYMAPRPGAPTLSHNATGDVVRTDGAVAVVQLRDCQPIPSEVPPAEAAAHYKPGNIAFRYVRKEILIFRSDIWRANIIYGLYDLGRMAVESLHNHPGVQEASEPTSPPSATTTVVATQSALASPGGK